MSATVVTEPSAKLRKQITQATKKISPDFKEHFNYLVDYVAADYEHRKQVVTVAKGLMDLNAQRAVAKAELLKNKVYLGYKQRCDMLHEQYINCPTFAVDGVEFKRPSPMGEVRTALKSLRDHLHKLEDGLAFSGINKESKTLVEQLMSIPEWESLVADVGDEDLRKAVEIEVKKYQNQINKEAPNDNS